jgi:hypothetical protein
MQNKTPTTTITTKTISHGVLTNQISGNKYGSVM